MAPRSYDLGRRATTAAETRRRIIDAATALYRERGVAGTSLAAVAERADVARGTVVNHFGTADGLLGVVVDEVLVAIEVPDERTSRVRAPPRNGSVASSTRRPFRTTGQSWWSLPARHG
jgi:AcrR family transcriptional regulator